MPMLTFALPLAGLLALAVLLVIGLKWWLLDCSERLRASITGCVFATGFVLGVIGFSERYGAATPRPPELRIFANAVHSTLQLVVLSLDAASTPGLELGLARVLLPLAAAQLIVAAVLTHARQALLRAQLNSGFGGPDVVFLGCSETGLRIAHLYEKLLDPDASRRKRASRRVRGRVLGIDSNLTAPSARAFQERYWLYQVPLDPEDTPTSLRLERRRGVVISTGDERADIALLSRVARSIASRRARRPAVVVAVDSDAVPRACQLDPALSAAYANGTIQFIFPGRLDARQLYREHPPHSFSSRRFLANEKNHCHVALVAHAASLDALASQAVRALVYDPSAPLRLTVWTENAGATGRAFFSRYPALTQSPGAWSDAAYGAQLPLAHIEFLEHGLGQLDAHAFRTEHAAQRMDVVYVVGRHDAETCLLAAEVFKVVATLAEPRPAVVVCLRDVKAHACPPDGALGVTARFFELGSWADSAAAASELSAVLPDAVKWSKHPDEVAERLWRAYGADPNTRTWEATAHHVKWWNRFAADHAALKLALLGMGETATEQDLSPLLDDAKVRDWLSRLEHRRYVCERMTDGWLSFSGPKATAYLLNPTLVPFDALPGREANKDTRVVDDLRVMLRT